MDEAWATLGHAHSRHLYDIQVLGLYPAAMPPSKAPAFQPATQPPASRRLSSKHLAYQPLDPVRSTSGAVKFDFAGAIERSRQSGMSKQPPKPMRAEPTQGPDIKYRDIAPSYRGLTDQRKDEKIQQGGNGEKQQLSNVQRANLIERGEYSYHTE